MVRCGEVVPRVDVECAVLVLVGQHQQVLPVVGTQRQLPFRYQPVSSDRLIAGEHPLRRKFGELGSVANDVVLQILAYVHRRGIEIGGGDAAPPHQPGRCRWPLRAAGAAAGSGRRGTGRCRRCRNRGHRLPRQVRLPGRVRGRGPSVSAGDAVSTPGLAGLVLAEFRRLAEHSVVEDAPTRGT